MDTGHEERVGNKQWGEFLTWKYVTRTAVLLVKQTFLSWSFVDILQFPKDKLEKRPKPEGPNDSFCSK